LKSQLRNRLIAELQETAGQAGLTAEHDQSAVPDNLFELAANSLVADHLKRCKYEYSLSVFLPESGLQENKVNSALFFKNPCFTIYCNQIQFFFYLI